MKKFSNILTLAVLLVVVLTNVAPARAYEELTGLTETRKDYHPHHDFLRIYNPKLKAYTTLYIANKDLTNEQCIAAGCDPKNAPCTGAQVQVCEGTQ